MRIRTIGVIDRRGDIKLRLYRVRRGTIKSYKLGEWSKSARLIAVWRSRVSATCKYVPAVVANRQPAANPRRRFACRTHPLGLRSYRGRKLTPQSAGRASLSFWEGRRFRQCLCLFRQGRRLSGVWLALGRVACQPQRSQPRGLFTDRASVRLVFGHRLLTLPQAFLLFLEKCLGAVLRLIRIHAQVGSSLDKGKQMPSDIVQLG
jgi:hypothetical protein